MRSNIREGIFLAFGILFLVIGAVTSNLRMVGIALFFIIPSLWHFLSK